MNRFYRNWRFHQQIIQFLHRRVKKEPNVAEAFLFYLQKYRPQLYVKQIIVRALSLTRPKKECGVHKSPHQKMERFNNQLEISNNELPFWFLNRLTLHSKFSFC